MFALLKITILFIFQPIELGRRSCMVLRARAFSQDEIYSFFGLFRRNRMSFTQKP